MNKYDEHITEKEFQESYEPLGLEQLRKELLLHWDKSVVNRMLYDYQQLLERATPKIVITAIDNGICVCACPKCYIDLYFGNENYCPSCGQALEFNND